MRAPFSGNEATRWGNASEDRALGEYQAATRQRIEGCMFQVRECV